MSVATLATALYDRVMVIPAHLADEVGDEAIEMTAYEDFVVERVRGGESITGVYPCTRDEHRAAFEAWRREKGR